MDINEYIKLKNKSKRVGKLKTFSIKLMTIIIIFLGTIIITRKDIEVKNFINEKLLSNNFSFTSFKNLYSKYFGSVLPFDFLLTTEPVFNEKLEYSNISKYKDGISLSVITNYLVPVQESGVVVFVGEKEDYGNTIIVESENVTIWYSNINSNIKLYDEVKSGEYLVEVKDDKLYLVFQKEGVYVDYKDYI